MKGYKGFSKGLICRGKQYAENTVFEEDSAEVCRSGMHFCTNPLDVLDFYLLVNADGSTNEFAEVEALDEPVTNDQKKYSSKKLRVGARLDLRGLVKAAIEVTMETATKKRAGYSAKLAASGDSAKLAASGDSAQLAASGNSAQLAASGDFAQLAASGKYSVAAGVGINNTASAVAGGWIVLAEWKYNRAEDAFVPVCVKCAQVDGEKIKPNVFYKLENGEFVEVKE